MYTYIHIYREREIYLQALRPHETVGLAAARLRPAARDDEEDSIV